MQKLLIVSFVLSLSLRGFGADVLPKDSYTDYKCKSEVQTELTKLFVGKDPAWDRTADPSFDTQAFRTPMSKVGEWYELQITEKGLPKLLFYSSAKTSTWTWNKTCKAANTKGPGLEFFKPVAGSKSEAYGDADLAKLMSEKRTAMIYVWSPRMVYSVTEFTRVRALAEKRKMEFIPVLDPMVEVKEARAALKKAGIDFQIKTASGQREPSSVALYKRMNSVELYMRNGTLHFPTIFLSANGKLHTRRLVGVLTNDDLNKSLDEMTGELK
jgi:hypothetical protein